MEFYEVKLPSNALALPTPEQCVSIAIRRSCKNQAAELLNNISHNLFHMPEYPPACWWDEWPEPRVPLGEAQMKYASKPVPKGAKFRNAPLLAAGIGILRVCHLLCLSLILQTSHTH